jgi:hypothetical protein
MAINDEKVPEGQNFGDKNYYDGFAPGGDTEAQQTSGPRKMSRIDRPVTKSISGSITGRKSVDGNMPDETDLSIGKQIELEAGNAIKYRTCSWQKV